MNHFGLFAEIDVTKMPQDLRKRISLSDFPIPGLEDITSFVLPVTVGPQTGGFTDMSADQIEEAMKDWTPSHIAAHGNLRAEDNLRPYVRRIVVVGISNLVVEMRNIAYQVASRVAADHVPTDLMRFG